jgi:beta-phosphoglucomutase
VPAFHGAIFDVDGVLVDSPHEKAWRESLRELMEGEWNDIRDRTTWSPGAFTPQVYQEEMSGKPRMSGARAALEYFHVPDDDGARLAEYAQRKQEMVVRLIEAAVIAVLTPVVRGWTAYYRGVVQGHGIVALCPLLS